MKIEYRNRRKNAAINASSMADIAFLLLIFFLVTTTIVIDNGIAVKLPPWTDEPVPPTEIASRNVFRVVVNSQDQLLVEGELSQVMLLKERVKNFITNPQQDPTLAKSPSQAIISLQNDRGTTYNRYIEVYNELKRAYNEIWDEAALERYDFRYKDLQRSEQKAIQKDFPFVISESEPSVYGDLQE